jgi:hypothetical protein
MKVYFKHYPEEEGLLKVTDTLAIPYKGKTACFVEEDKTDEQLLYGEAFCSVNDIFDKARGRKVSLARAIEGLDKKKRTAFWKAYVETTSRL